jgi:parallel beta-helix repeat protein
MRLNQHSFLRLVLLCTLTLAAAAAAGPVAAETRVSGKLKGEHEWTKGGSPYIVTGDVIIPKGSTLRIGPGVTVRFKADIPSREGVNLADLELLVRGTLIVEGAPQDTVVLTSDARRPRWTDWAGIIIEGAAGRAELDAAIVEFANEGIKCMRGTLIARNTTVRRGNYKGIHLIEGEADFDNLLVTQVGNEGGTGIGVNVDRGSRVTMKNSIVVGAQNGIIFSRGSSGTVENTVVSMNAIRGIAIRKSDPVITGCTISQNDYGLAVSGGARPVVRQNNIFLNGTLDLSLSEYREEVKLDFSNNWWGETHLSLIEERIRDALDDPAIKAYAVIEPILSEAFTPPAGDAKDH